MKTQLLLEAAQELLDSGIALPGALRQKFIDGIERATEDLVKHVTSDVRLRRFRIVMESGAKYKTIQLSRERFNALKDNTLNQWATFLKDHPSEYTQYQRARKGS